MFTSRVHLLKFQADDRLDPQVAAAAGPAAPTARIDYHGGKVIQNAHVVQVLYGSGAYIPELTSTSGFNMASAYTQMVTSGVLDWLNEYSTLSPVQMIGRGWFDGAVQISPAAPRNGAVISDASVQSELVAQIRAEKLPAPSDNRIYMVSFPPDRSLIAPDGSLSCVAGGFCAYHGTFRIGSQNVYYAVLPSLTGGCATGCGTGTAFRNQQAVASHELVGVITDPEVGLATVAGAPRAWYGANDDEIGDLCTGRQADFVGIDDNSYVIEKGFSSQENDCIAPEPARRQHQIFRGVDNHVHELYNNGMYWTNNDLTDFLDGASPAGNLAGYNLDTKQHIVFRTADGHLHGFYNNGTTWVDNDLTLTVGGAGPAGDPSGYILRDTQHVVFRSADDHVHELFHDGEHWANNDLTMFIGGASAMGNPSGYTLGNTQHIVFRGKDGHLHQYYENGTWIDQDLTVMAGGASLAGDPSGYSLVNTQHIVFRSPDNHVHELYHDGTRWTDRDLTMVTGVSCASNPSGYVLGDTLHIVFRGTDGHLHQLSSDGAGWQDHDLTALIGGTGPTGDPTGYILGNTQHIVFRSKTDHLHEFFHNGAFWVNNDLTTSIGGVGPADRVAGYVSR